jgi:hypothetical protein
MTLEDFWKILEEARRSTRGTLEISAWLVKHLRTKTSGIAKLPNGWRGIQDCVQNTENEGCSLASPGAFPGRLKNNYGGENPAIAVPA